MFETRTNPTSNGVLSGKVVVGDYNYYLYIGLGKPFRAFIKREKTDLTEVKFFAIPQDGAIADYWTTPEANTYEWANVVF